MEKDDEIDFIIPDNNSQASLDNTEDSGLVLTRRRSRLASGEEQA